MTQKESIIYLLGKFGDKTRVELTNLWYEFFPEIIDYHRQRLNITEKELYHKVEGWIASYPKNMPNAFKTERINGTLHYSLTDSSKLIYNDIVSKIENGTYQITSSEIDEIDDLNEPNNDPTDNITQDNIGIVYLLVSDRYSDTYKIGVTSRSIEERMNELKTHQIYGIFNLYPKMYFKCDSFTLIEEVMHKFFEDYRIGRYNKKDATELFQGNVSIEEEFELFYRMLYDNPRYKSTIKELIKL